MQGREQGVPSRPTTRENSICAERPEAMNPLSMRCLQALSTALLALCAMASAHAQLVPGYPDDVMAYDPREVAMLPAYCKYTQDFRDKVPGGADPSMIARWQGF